METSDGKVVVCDSFLFAALLVSLNFITREAIFRRHKFGDS